MALLSPRLLRRGLELFAAISALGFIGLLLYGNNFQQFLTTMGSLHWGWVLAGVALASMDWLAGGLRIWILTRHLDPRASLKGSILAGGLCTWAGYLTPLQTGAGPMMIYTLKRYGTPLPDAVIATFMSFVATVVFFAVAGPLAVLMGGGQSLQKHGILNTISLYDLFNISLSAFVAIGIFMFTAFLFPGLARRWAQGAVRWFEAHGSPNLARGAAKVKEGVDRAHDGMQAFLKARGWLALGGAVVLSGPSHANKLLAGFVVLRMLGIGHVNFVDVLLLQTLITFLLYFAPTPGGSGLAELISVAVMSIYVPRALTPSYILLWRIVVSYLTVAFGSFLFWSWLKGVEGRDDAPLEEEPVPVG